MNQLLLHEKIEKVLQLRRIISVNNLLSLLDISFDQILQVLNDFKEKAYIRISHGKTCSSGCSSCSTCSTIQQEPITENDIIVSLLFVRTEDYADQ